MQAKEEAAILRVCKNKVKTRGLPMRVVDCELQYDRHKCTFFFQSER